MTVFQTHVKMAEAVLTEQTTTVALVQMDLKGKTAASVSLEEKTLRGPCCFVEERSVLQN